VFSLIEMKMIIRIAARHIKNNILMI